MKKHIILMATLLTIAACGDERGPRTGVGPRTGTLPTLDSEACQSSESCRQVADACNGDELCRSMLEAETLDKETGETTNLVAEIIEGAPG